MAQPQTVTPDDVVKAIKEEFYFTAYEGVLGERFHHERVGDPNKDKPDIPPTLRLMTICVLVLNNGFTVVGTSACADPLKYNKEMGQSLAREKATDQVWAFLGFMLRDRMSKEEQFAEAQAAVAQKIEENEPPITSTSSPFKARPSSPAASEASVSEDEGADAVGTGPAQANLAASLTKDLKNVSVETKIVPPTPGGAGGNAASTSNPFQDKD